MVIFRVHKLLGISSLFIIPGLANTCQLKPKVGNATIAVLNLFFMDILPILTLILAGLAFVAAGSALYLARSVLKLKKTFFNGTQAQDLEHIIYGLVAKLDSQAGHQAALEQELVRLKQHVSHTFHKIGIIRFNPFEDGGGNFSFALALLNEHNSGFVITSMHGRQQCRVYTKRLLKGKSETQLTDEEYQAVQIALQEANERV